VARKEGLTPPPSFSEQLEAAIGLCQLRPDLYERYNVEYVAYHVGQLIKEFVDRVQKDQTAINAAKIYAARLGAAVNDMNSMTAALTDTRRRQAQAKYVSDFAGRATKLLTGVERKAVDSSPLSDFSNWLQQTKRTSMTAYEGVAESVIKEGEAATGGN